MGYAVQGEPRCLLESVEKFELIRVVLLLFFLLTAIADAVAPPSSNPRRDAGWTRVELSDFLREDIRFPLLIHRWNNVETRKVLLLLVSIPPHRRRRLELLSARRLREEASATAVVVVRRRRVVGGSLIIVGFDGCRLGDLNRWDNLDLVL